MRSEEGAPSGQRMGAFPIAKSMEKTLRAARVLLHAPGPAADFG